MIRLFGGGEKRGQKEQPPTAAKSQSQPEPAAPTAAEPPAPEPAPPPTSQAVVAEPVRPQPPKLAGSRRVLLADDSPHAQRMGERILREVGYEVITVTDGETALMRLSDADPDVVLADASLPGRSGYDICQEIKQNPRYSHVRVVLTAGLLEAFDDRRAEAVRSDGVLKKPFESTALTDLVGRLAGAPRVRPAGTVAAPAVSRRSAPPPPVLPGPPPSTSGIVPVRVVSDAAAATIPAEIDAERVRAAITLALDAALPGMIDKITERVLVALKQKTS
jgi:CheY-like chemotaxis protein